MSNGSAAGETTPQYLLPSACGSLRPGEIDALWAVVEAIHAEWSEPNVDPRQFCSQWLEFVRTRTDHSPSYLEEYRSAIRVLAELKTVYGDNGMWKQLFFEHGSPGIDTRFGHLRKYVVEEFIRVWLAAGGFKAYGARNYNGYVSGSRFAIDPPYRLASHPE